MRTDRNRDLSGATRPLYARMLRLRHIRPGSLLCAGYVVVPILVAAALAVTGQVRWWVVVMLPVLVAAMVKLNDVIAGAVDRPPGATHGGPDVLQVEPGDDPFGVAPGTLPADLDRDPRVDADPHLDLEPDRDPRTDEDPDLAPDPDPRVDGEPTVATLVLPALSDVRPLDTDPTEPGSDTPAGAPHGAADAAGTTPPGSRKESAGPPTDGEAGPER